MLWWDRWLRVLGSLCKSYLRALSASMLFIVTFYKTVIVLTCKQLFIQVFLRVEIFAITIKFARMMNGAQLMYQSVYNKYFQYIKKNILSLRYACGPSVFVSPQVSHIHHVSYASVLGVLKRTPKIFVWAYAWKLSNDMHCRALYYSKTAHATKNCMRCLHDVSDIDKKNLMTQ